MNALRTIVLCAAMMLWTHACPAAPGDLAGMYSAEQLDEWQLGIKPLVSQVLDEDVLPLLSTSIRDALRKKSFGVDVMNSAGDPFSFQRSGARIEVPTIGLRLLHDLLLAHVWLETNHFEDQSVLYVLALRYRSPGEFPGGRYLPPLEALGVPKSISEGDLDVTASLRFEKLFRSALFFIIAHETCHAIQFTIDDLKHRTTLEVESEADIFAFMLMARQQVDPSGVTWIFLYRTAWDSGDSDFYAMGSPPSDLPLAPSARVSLLGEEIRRDPASYFPGVDTTDPRVRALKVIGETLSELGKQLLPISTRQAGQDIASAVDIAGLAIHRPRTQ